MEINGKYSKKTNLRLSHLRKITKNNFININMVIHIARFSTGTQTAV